MSRPIGSKNRKTAIKEKLEAKMRKEYEALLIKQGLKEPKKRGRPAGSKNKIGSVKKAPVDPRPVIKQRGRKKKEFSDYMDELKDLSLQQDPYCVMKNYDNIEFYNCTGHDINIAGVGKIQPHTFLRVAENSFTKGTVQGIPIYETAYTVGMLSPPVLNRIYVVGQLVCIAAPERSDLYIPYRVNHIDKSCKGLVQNPFYKANKDFAKKHGFDLS